MVYEFPSDAGFCEEVVEVFVIITTVLSGRCVWVLQEEWVSLSHKLVLSGNAQLLGLKDSTTGVRGSKNRKFDFFGSVLQGHKFLHELLLKCEFYRLTLLFRALHGPLRPIFGTFQNVRDMLILPGRTFELIIDGNVDRMADKHVLHKARPLRQSLAVHAKFVFGPIFPGAWHDG